MGPRLAAAGSPRSERQRKNKHLVWAYGIDHMTTLRCPSHMIPHHGSTTTACRCMWPGQRGGGQMDATRLAQRTCRSGHRRLVLANVPPEPKNTQRSALLACHDLSGLAGRGSDG